VRKESKNEVVGKNVFEINCLCDTGAAEERQLVEASESAKAIGEEGENYEECLKNFIQGAE
jgi:hypothetical protein